MNEGAITTVAFELGPTFLRSGGVDDASQVSHLLGLGEILGVAFTSCFPSLSPQLLYHLHDNGFANWVSSNPHDVGDGVLAPPHTFREVCSEVESRTYPFTDVVARHSSFWDTWRGGDLVSSLTTPENLTER